MMKRKIHLKLFLIILPLLIFACKEEEDVVPVKTESEDTASVSSTIAKVPEKSKSIGVDSAFYDYGKFESMPFRIMLPRKYDVGKAYPLLIFLHGIDERGSDNEKQLTWGANLFKSDSISKNHPAFVVFPQCPKEYYWFDKMPSETLKKLIDKLIADYNVDTNRIYIAGLSMGAYGTYAMVANNPGFFAAAVAISGDGDEHKANAMAKTQWRIFAGKKDDIVSSDKSEKMVDALKKSGASVKFTLYPEANHVASWINAFSEPDFCSWLFSISKD